MAGSGSGGIRAGRAFVEVFADDSKLARGLNRAQARLKSFGAGVESIGRGLIQSSAAVVASLTGSVLLLSKTGDALDKMAERTGIGVEALSALKFAAEQSGSSIDEFEKGIRRMQQTIAEAAAGSSSASDTLARLGLTIADLQGLAPDEQFKRIADRIAAIEDPAARTAAAMEIFGKSGAALLPLLNQGAAGISDLEKQARDLGLTMSAETAAKAALLNDTLNILKLSVAGVAQTVAAALVPTVLAASKRASEVASRFIGWVKANQETVVTVAKVAAGALALGAGLVVLGKTLGVVAVAIGGVSTALTFLLAHPVVAVMAGIAIAVGAVAVAYSRLVNEARRAAQVMTEVRSAGDQQRAADLARIARLQELSQKQSLNNIEQREATKIVQELTSVYGPLGARVDEATGKLANLAQVLETVNSRMREQAIMELEAEVRSLRKVVDEESRKIAHALEVAKEMETMQMGLGDPTVELAMRKVEEHLKAQQKLLAQIRELQERINALRRGDAAALAGGVTVPDSIGKSPQIGGRDRAEEIADWERRIRQLRIALIEDEWERERQLIEERYKYELERAKGNDELIRKINEARELELQRLAQERAKREAEERRRIDDANKRRMETIEELRLRLAYQGLELERQLLALRHKQELERARQAGEDLELVNQEYDLRRKLLDLQEQADSFVQRTVRGIFEIGRLQGLQVESTDGDSKAHALIKQTNDLLERLLREARDQEGPIWI